MCLVCSLAAFLPGATENGSVDVRRVVAGLGSALVLWESRRQDFGLRVSREQIGLLV
jgi:hypothetical protein